jgi:NTP pyrophosphatase (non-canonical NTP hydrolase)
MSESIFERCIRVWGTIPQMRMAIEEMAELTKEICKAFRGEDNRTQILDEIADVLIMLKQLSIVYSMTREEIEKQVNFKLSRIKVKLDKAEGL